MTLAEEIKRLELRYSLETDDAVLLERAAAELERQGAALAEMRDGFTHIAEYWNGAEGSAVDAAEEARDTANTILAKTDAWTDYVPKAQLDNGAAIIRECNKQLIKVRAELEQAQKERDINFQLAASAQHELNTIKGSPFEVERKELVEFLEKNWPELCSVDAWPVNRAIFKLREFCREQKEANQRNAELEKDKARLDWLQNNFVSEAWEGVFVDGKTVRQAIDAAMTKEDK